MRGYSARGRERGKCAVGERRLRRFGREEERGTPGATEGQGDARTDERPPGIIAAGVVRSGGHSITTQWRAYYVVSERV